MTPTDNRPCTCHPDMTRPDLDALAALLDKATPGHHPLSTAESAAHHMANAKDEIVRALPALLAYVRELEAERDALRERAEGLK